MTLPPCTKSTCTFATPGSPCKTPLPSASKKTRPSTTPTQNVGVGEAAWAWTVEPEKFKKELLHMSAVTAMETKTKNPTRTRLWRAYDVFFDLLWLTRRIKFASLSLEIAKCGLRYNMSSPRAAGISLLTIRFLSYKVVTDCVTKLKQRFRQGNLSINPKTAQNRYAM